MDALIDLRFESDIAVQVWKGSERYARRERYIPYFYAICRNPDEMRWLLSSHPKAIDVSIEYRYPHIHSSEKAPLVRIRTALADFKSVASDIRKVPGVLSLAETTIPHHFRYCMDKGLSFFDSEPELTMEMAGPDGRVSPHVDVAFSWGPIPERIPAIHLDLKEDLRHDIYGEPFSGKDLLALGKERFIRVMELSHLTSVRPGTVSRITPGRLNTFLHMQAARERGYVIPDTKKEVERPKSLNMLRRMDKGGTIFYPPPGIYRDVAKCDFASMYPNIIVKYNITPEKMHCSCGDDIEMPISGWKICRKRGIIPYGIEKVLLRRLALKKMMKAEQDPEKKRMLDIRQKALKNILVTCFGYLGFSNFVFSNVECKEAVMLYGRHILERTKEMAEEDGLEVLYGIVDSVFVRIADSSTLETNISTQKTKTKNLDSEARFERFVKRVSDEFGIELELDCVFRAIAFPCAEDGSGVANKYYGMTYDNEIEARGIAYRHSDAPKFIKDFEREAIPKMLERDLDGLRAVFETYRARIFDDSYSLDELSITKSIREEEYKVNAPHVVAYRHQPTGLGYVIYVFTKSGPMPLDLAKRLGEKPDPVKYEGILMRAREEITRGLWKGMRSSFRQLGWTGCIFLYLLSKGCWAIGC